ncbi:MAG: hypothetical protein KDA61_16560, partial [Planctomycetales bacterium]|nr:hypothetical protein [Planctomycetales bacterium]
SGSFGSSPMSAPSEFGDFATELNLSSASTELRIADGDTPGVYDPLTTLAVDQWYDVWVHMDAAIDASRVWLKPSDGLSASSTNLLTNSQGTSTFGFRTAGVSGLQTFYIKTGSGGSPAFGPLLIDDLYLQTAAVDDLRNPLGPYFTADFNADGMVDDRDRSIWESAFGASNLGDADGDGATTGADLLVWQRQFVAGPLTSETPLALTAVPEPTACAIVCAIGACLASGRPVHRRSRGASIAG